MRTSFVSTSRTEWLLRSLALAGVALIGVTLLGSRTARAQVFDSGSNGSDGALNLTTPGTIIFDPRGLGLDPDGDNIYHFTSITIGAGVTVRLLASHVNGPVFWLASGPVQINGVIDLNGADGQGLNPAGVPLPALPGSGGFPGGVKGGVGSGPYGGIGPVPNGPSCILQPTGGGGPRSRFLVPLLGGSGGGGNTSFGGGAGGGALLIASSNSITIGGTIKANGGSGLSSGGGGGGGGIRLAAPTISGGGRLEAQRGNGNPSRTCDAAGRGEPGVIRLEAFQNTFTGSVPPDTNSLILASPFAVFLPQTPPPLLRVVSVAGLSVASDSTGSFTMPDVIINASTAVPVAIEAHNIPPGTVVHLYLFSENGADQVVDSLPLVGTPAVSTATASTVLPPGFSRGFVRATWVP